MRKSRLMLVAFVLVTLGLQIMMAGSVLAADRFVIGYVTKTLINDPFQVLMANAAKEAGEARGAEVLLYGGSGQAAIEEEMTIVENLIAQDVDGIVLNPLDARALIPAVRKINQAGIPLVLIDNSIADGEYITYIATDNVRGAALAAEYIAMLLNGEGKVAMIEGEPGGQAANDRRKGFHDFMATVPGIEIVSSLTGHWTTEGAISATEAILQAHPDVQAIFACADMMAVGVAQVLSRANREDVILVSFDGIEEGLDLVKQGKSAGDIAQFPTTIGSMSVDILLDVLSGEKDAADYPKYMDSGTALITKYTVDAFAEEVLGIK